MAGCKDVDDAGLAVADGKGVRDSAPRQPAAAGDGPQLVSVVMGGDSSYSETPSLEAVDDQPGWRRARTGRSGCAPAAASTAR